MNLTDKITDNFQFAELSEVNCECKDFFSPLQFYKFSLAMEQNIFPKEV
jgi:hypothetical protein